MRAGGGQSTALASTLLLGTALTFFACTGGPSTPESGGSSSSSSSSSSSGAGTSGGSSSSSGTNGVGGEGPYCPSQIPECGGGASSGEPYVAPQTIASATLSGAGCTNAGKTISIGAVGDPARYSPWNGNNFSLACTVRPSGNQFGVETNLYFDDSASSIGINALVSATDPKETVITYVKVGGTEYKSKDCTVEYPINGGVAAGRFWAKLSCPVGDHDCAIEAEVRVENCKQQ